MMAMMQWSSALEALTERIGPRFARSEGTQKKDHLKSLAL